jgi:hypothetical protein
MDYTIDTTSQSILTVTNNIEDIDGAFKNYNLDTTNSLLIKVNTYEKNQN